MRKKYDASPMSVSHPHLTLDFDTDRNAPLTADNIRAGTMLLLNWKCHKCKNEWLASGSNRSHVKHPTGCPVCCSSGTKLHSAGINSLQATHPKLASEFDIIKNLPRTPTNTTAGTMSRLWWICSACKNSWDTIAASRSRKTKPSGCPACAGLSVHTDGRNCMAETHPFLALEFDPVRNAPRTVRNTIAGSNCKIWWSCSTCSHSWKTVGSSRAKACPSGCPKCSNQNPSEHIWATYLHCLLTGSFFTVDTKTGEESKVSLSNGKKVQVDARVYYKNVLYACCLYDGRRGHQDSERSRKKDIQRRSAVVKDVNIPWLLAFRHGMQGLHKEVDSYYYDEVVSGRASSILSGAIRMAETILLRPICVTTKNIEDLMYYSWRQWLSMPEKNLATFDNTILVEILALKKEGFELLSVLSDIRKEREQLLDIRFKQIALPEVLAPVSA